MGQKSSICKGLFSKLRIAGFLISGTLMAIQANALVVSNNMKWFPGHYALNELSDSATHELLTDFKDIPSFRGIQRSYFWSNLETSKGIYNFSEIDKDIAILKVYNRKLSIMIGYKYQVSATKSSLPDYILSLPKQMADGISVPSYYVQSGGGPYNDGHHANFGHPGTLAGFSNLLKALAEKYDKDPNVAFLQFIETSVGAPLTTTQSDNFLNGIEKMQTAAKVAFATTPIIQNLNYPRNRLPGFINNLKANRMGFGGPDVFIGAYDEIDNGLTFTGTYPGIYIHNESNYDNITQNNTLPIGMHVHHENFIYETMDLRLAKIETTFTPTEMVNELFDFAINRLHSNFITWQIYNNDIYKGIVRNKLLSELAKDPKGMGGVIEKCPSIFDSCAGVLPPADTILPLVSITSPASGSIVNVATNVSISASDNVGVTKVELYAGGAFVGSKASAPYTITYTPPASIDADVNLVAKAYDAAGNVQSSASILVLVRNAPKDTIAPYINIVNPVDGDIIPANAYSLSILARASDADMVSSIKLFINGKLKKTVTNLNELSFDWAVRNVSAGSYTIKVEAQDPSGNVRSKSVTVRVRQ